MLAIIALPEAIVEKLVELLRMRKGMALRLAGILLILKGIKRQPLEIFPMQVVAKLLQLKTVNL